MPFPVVIASSFHGYLQPWKISRSFVFKLKFGMMASSVKIYEHFEIAVHPSATERYF